jgi:CheY-like chemotaxis protein
MAAPPPLITNMPRILVVEDDLDLQFLYSASLSRSGYEVAVAKNAADAMLLLTSRHSTC